MLEKKQKAIDLLRKVSNMLNLKFEDKIYIDLLEYHIKENKPFIDYFTTELEKIDKEYSKEVKDNLLLLHHKNFINLCRKLEKSVIAS